MVLYKKWFGIATITNKRAQRALGRSPEEKVKGKRSQWSHLQRTTNNLSTKY